MPFRRSPVMITKEDKEAIGKAAARIKLQEPRLSDRQAILRATVEVLPAHHVPHTLKTTPSANMRTQFAAMAAELERLQTQFAAMTAELERLQSASLPEEAPAEEAPAEEVRQAAAPPALSTEPTEEDLGDDPAILAHALVDRIFRPKPDVSAALLLRTKALEQRFEALASDVRDIGAGVRAFHGVLTRILGDLESYSAPLAAEVARVEPALPPSPPAAVPPVPPRPEPPQKPRIGLIGPLPDQAQHIARLVGEAAQVVLFDREKPINKGLAVNLDYFIVTRHSGHARANEAESVLPRHRVVRIITGGIRTAADRIKALAASANGINPTN